MFSRRPCLATEVFSMWSCQVGMPLPMCRGGVLAANRSAGSVTGQPMTRGRQGARSAPERGGRLATDAAEVLFNEARSPAVGAVRFVRACLSPLEVVLEAEAPLVAGSAVASVHGSGWPSTPKAVLRPKPAVGAQEKTSRRAVPSSGSCQ
jgi:hypothetical protein